MKPCSVCSNKDNNKIHKAQEKMLGMQDTFSYQECSKCGLVELLDVPQDLGKYYPRDYYSFRRPSPLKQYLKQKRGSYTFGKSSVLGALTHKLLGPSPLHQWFKEADVKEDDAIIDVGCGYGSYISELRYSSFKKVQGLDPNISAPIKHGKIEVKKSYLKDLESKSYDFIMLHHSFEHMDNQRESVKELARVLSDGGKILIRIPVIGYAWRHYGINWYGLDAPRHLFLHSQKSITMLLEEFGLKVNKVVFDSSEQQFWGSEQYQNNIWLESENSYFKNPKKSMFTPEKISSFRQRAEELNQKQDGDAACFYIERM